MRTRSQVYAAETLNQIYIHGIRGLWVVLISMVFSGQVIISEFAYHIQLIMEDLSFVPAFATQLIVTEFGPMLACLLMVSFSGASIAAETGMMRVTEQWEAYKVERIPIWQFYILPRVVACMLVCVILTIYNIAGEMLIANLTSPWILQLSWHQYWDNMFTQIDSRDFLQGILKGMIFGITYSSIAIAVGLRAERTAASIGRKSTEAVVLATLAIIIEDFVISYIFSVT